MGRIRTIKPEFPQSESMGRVSRDARLLFVMLWTIVDDSGRTRAASRMLASLLFPYDDDAPRLIEGWLSELEREGCIVRYTSDDPEGGARGSQYLEIRKWADHQKIDRPTPSKIPPPREGSRGIARAREGSLLDLDLDLDLDQGPRTNTDTRERDPGAGSTVPEHPDPDPSPDRSAEPPCEPAADDGGATPCEQDRAAKPRPRQVPRYDADPRFVAAWAAYGRDAAKKQAWDQWQKLMPNDELAAEILAGIRRMVAARPEAKYRPDMHRWLRDFRWTEHPPAETAPRPATRFMQHHSEVPAQRLLPDGSLDDGWDEYDEQVARRKG